MSLAVLSSAYPVLSETFVYREAQALAARGHGVVTVALRRPPREATARGVPPAELAVYGRGTLAAAAREALAHPARTLRTLGTAAADALAPGEPMRAADRLKLLAQAGVALGVAHELRRRGVSHVHCHFAHAPASVGMYAATQLGAGFSFVGHANDLFERRALLGKKLARADFVSCISRFHRDLYRELVPGGADRYVVVRCGVDAARWSARAPRPEPGRLHVVTVARLVAKKGIDTLIRAVALAPELTLTVCGDGPEAGALESLAGELGLGERVRFLGALDNDRVREEMAAADVFALPCRVDARGDRDGIPVVLMEAMALGLPVVAGDLPAIRELVAHEDTGLLAPPDDVQAFAGLLQRLARDPALLERLSRQGRAHIEAEFSQEVNVARLERALEAARRPPR